MDGGVKIEVMWFDDEVVELRVHGSNGRFAGTAELYASPDVFSEVANSLRGFPSSIRDHRQIELGTFDPSCGGGGVRLTLRCVDAAAHAVIEMSVRTDPRYHYGQTETAELVIPVEAAAIDEFVVELQRMEVAVGVIARLRQAT